jgi:hypothetical protein
LNAALDIFSDTSNRILLRRLTGLLTNAFGDKGLASVAVTLYVRADRAEEVASDADAITQGRIRVRSCGHNDVRIADARWGGGIFEEQFV